MKSLPFILSLILLPLSLCAMTPVSDAELSRVSGQAGVSINPDLTMNIVIGTLAWGDSDGINPASGVNPWPADTAGGYVGVKDFSVTNLRVRLRDSDTYNGYSTHMMKPMTIDVATGYKPDSGYGNNTTSVRFGLGALKISTDQIQFRVALGPHANTAAGSAPALDQVLGVATLGPMNVYVNPKSSVDIYAHSPHGVTFHFDVTLDRMDIGYVSWGRQ